MQIFEFCPGNYDDCKVTAWIHRKTETDIMVYKERPAIIICPGGAYARISPRESEPVAKPYFTAGYHTFILNYAVGENAKDFRPLSQLAETVLHIRRHSSEWHVDPNKIVVCGFSAGGHLAASLGILHDNSVFLKAYGKDENIRPDAMILGYPVVTADCHAHVESIRRVSNCNEKGETYRWFGLEQHVNKNTPPAFLWHTATDAAVPVENSLKLALAFAKEEIPFELHIFPEGNHGMSVCTEEVKSEDAYNGRWLEWSVQWLNKLFQFRL